MQTPRVMMMKHEIKQTKIIPTMVVLCKHAISEKDNGLISDIIMQNAKTMLVNLKKKTGGFCTCYYCTHFC